MRNLSAGCTVADKGKPRDFKKGVSYLRVKKEI
jgi:hypothetical protein